MRVFFLASLFMAIVTAPVAAQQVPAAQPDMASLNFYRADLAEVVQILAQHLELSYTMDPEVKGSVTANSAEPLKKRELFSVLQQILRMKGATAVESTGLLHITPLTEGGRVAQKKADGYALWVAPVRFFPAVKMKIFLSPFLGAGGEIVDSPNGNLLIVTDLPSNIRRLAEIQALLDVRPFVGVRLEIYQTKAASAEELAAEMTKITEAYGPSTAAEDELAIHFLPIPGSDQLLIISRYSEATWGFVQDWLHRLDTAREGLGRRIFIYPVKNGRASEWIERLNRTGGGGLLRILPEPATNSLVIYATTQEFYQVRSALREDGTQEFKDELSSIAREIAGGKRMRETARIVTP